MKYIEGEDRNQMTFLPDCIEDYIDENNAVRVIEAFVNGLDMKALGFTHASLKETGRPPFDPKDLLKLYIYGYFNKIRSSRKLMQESGRNIEVLYLLKKLQPDFRTISDFRKENPAAIRKVFKSFVKLCLKLKLYQRELIAVDGSKFRAQNSDKNCYTTEVLEKKIAHIEKSIDGYLKQIDEADKGEGNPEEATGVQIRAAVKELEDRKGVYGEYLEQLKKSGETQLLTTDPEARRMHSKDGFHCCYNVQTAVDKGSHMIAEYEVINRTDVGHLKEVSEKAKETLEVAIIELDADKGYDSRKDILDCLMNGTVANVAPKYDKEDRVFTIEYEENEINEEIRNSEKPEDIRKCLHAGVLPKCYENSTIRVELQGRDSKKVLSCFEKNEDGTVTCPTGCILKKTRKHNNSTIYASRAACRQCRNKCTQSRFKNVALRENTGYVPVIMNEVEGIELRRLPDTVKPPNNFKKKANRQVLINMRYTKQMMKDRMCLSEHPFGTVKWNDGAHYVLCRGKEKAAAELGLSFLAYNLRRAINMIGIKVLIAAM